jgi:hypothetical protein
VRAEFFSKARGAALGGLDAVVKWLESKPGLVPLLLFATGLISLSPTYPHTSNLCYTIAV